MKIKGAIFDMDGTLVDSLMYWPHFWHQLGRKYWGIDHFEVSPEVDKQVRTMIYADAIAYIKELYHIPDDFDELLRYANNSIEDFYRQVVVPKSGALALLEHLKRQGIKMCVASATDLQYVKLCLSLCGMSDYFQSVLSCADIGVGKDCPDIYLLAMKELGLSPDEICVFEDSYVALETAKKVGFRTVGIYDQYNYDQARLERASDIYVDKHRTLDSLMVDIEGKSL